MTLNMISRFLRCSLFVGSLIGIALVGFASALGKDEPCIEVQVPTDPGTLKILPRPTNIGLCLLGPTRWGTLSDDYHQSWECLGLVYSGSWRSSCGGRGGLGIYVLGIPLWIPLALFSVYPMLFLARRPARLRASRQRQGVCVNCGYNLTGNTSGACPECGTLYCQGSADTRQHEQRDTITP